MAAQHFKRCSDAVANAEALAPCRRCQRHDVCGTLDATAHQRQCSSASASASASASLCQRQHQCQRQPMSVSVPAPSSAPVLSSAPAPAPSSALVPAHPPATRCDLRCVAITGASLSAISSPKLKRSGTSNTTQEVMGPEQRQLLR
jgi:hypothetical protein